MQGSRKRRNTLFAGISLVAVAVAAGIVLTGTAIAGKSGHAASSPPYDFVVSNNFLGNDWRPQVEKLAAVDGRSCRRSRARSTSRSSTLQSTNQAQIADLNSIIQTKPDVIMLIPGSSTALNPTIKRACDAGILVFTISAPVTEPCAWNVNQDFFGGMTGVGQWMARS